MNKQLLLRQIDWWLCQSNLHQLNNDSTSAEYALGRANKFMWNLEELIREESDQSQPNTVKCGAV